MEASSVVDGIGLQDDLISRQLYDILIKETGGGISILPRVPGKTRDRQAWRVERSTRISAKNCRHNGSERSKTPLERMKAELKPEREVHL